MDEDHPHSLMDAMCPSFTGINRFVYKLAPAYLFPNYSIFKYRTPMFQKRRLTISGGSNADPNRCEYIQHLPSSQLSDYLNLPAKRQRVVDGAKILLDVAKESADWFPPLKSALGGVSALIKHYEVLVESMAVACN